MDLYRSFSNNPIDRVDNTGLEDDGKGQPGMAFPVGLRLLGLLFGPRAPKPTMPTGAPQFGRTQVKWGTGADAAAKRAKEITAKEARKLDRKTVREIRDWYKEVFKNNPQNLTALERYKLMQRILDLQRGFCDIILE